jgi:histidinol-phosphate phosphatase family protein
MPGNGDAEQFGPGVQRYLEGVRQLLAVADTDAMAATMGVLWEAWEKDRTVFIAGNGGSAATASHLAWDLLKQTQLPGRRSIRAHALTDSLPTITALANDQGFRQVFAYQLRSQAKPGDILLSISCSGQSANILEAISEARAGGLTVVGFGGFDGGVMRDQCDVYLHVPSWDYGKIESVHLALCHCITSLLAERALALTRTVFVDRDGVIFRNRPDHVKRWEEAELIPGSVQALARMWNGGYRIVVVTNQAAVGRGLIHPSELDRIHGRLADMVGRAGGRIERFMVCPHVPESDCECRKPRPGLLLQAHAELGVRLDTAWFVGDHISDMQAAAAVRCKGILVLSGRTSGNSAREEVDSVVDDLQSAADLILSSS